MTGVVLAATGGAYSVYRDGKTLEASLRGRLKHGRGSDQKVLVGDEVVLNMHDDGGVTIEEIAPRRSVLQRRNPGGSRGVRQIAANIDQVVVVGSVLDPAWNHHLMDRFMVIAEVNGFPLCIIVNKSDLGGPTADIVAQYQQAGYQPLVTSVPDATGIDALRSKLADKISLLTGPTGVGKSSLLNSVQPGLALRTATVSRRSRAGRHTTVAAEMHPIHAGGFVVDTPGLRDVGLWGVDPLTLESAFPEFEAPAQECRFDNCRHLKEPGCGVTAAVDRGEVSSTRLQSYRVLLEEATEAARHWK